MGFHIIVRHANAYGIRKGAATHAATGTTVNPPIVSIARRGEWSLGGVLQVYWHWGEPGDQLVGRLVACLDPDTEDFAVLPPHWIVQDPMKNEDIKEAMEMMYGPILQAYQDADENNPTGFLLRVLPSVIYHSEFILSYVHANPSHPEAMTTAS